MSQPDALHLPSSDASQERRLGLPAPAEGEPARGSTLTALSSTPDAMALVRALQRRWLLALTLALLVAPAGAAGAWYAAPRLLPAKYTARTTLYVAASRPVILSNASDSGQNFATYQRTQIALVKSRLVLNAVVNEPKVAELHLINNERYPEQWLEKQLKADYSIAPEILSISLIGERPDELVTIVEAVRDTYLREIVNREQNELNTRLDRLKQFYTTSDEVVRRKRRTLRSLAEATGSQDVATLTRTHQYLIERLSASQKELLQRQSELRTAQVEAAAEQSRERLLAEAPVPDGAVEEALRQDPLFERHRLDIVRLEEDLAKVRRLAARADEPLLHTTQAALAAARKAQEERRERLRPQIIALLRERARFERQANAVQRQERVAILQELEGQLKKEVKGLEDEIDRLKKGSMEIEALRDDIAQDEEVLKRIGAQVQAITVEFQAPSRITRLDKAMVLNNPDQRLKVTAATGGGLFALCLLGVSWWEFRARRVSGAGELVHGLGIRLVGSLPTLPEPARGEASGPGRPGDPAWRSLLTESIDVTRTVLMRAARLEGLKVVMVTSAGAGEGKTSLSSQLAVSLARGGFRTLLIDGDLRRPRLHELFEAGPGPGLNEVLRGEADARDALRPTPVARLDLIAAGAWDARSVEALTQGKFGACLDGLRGQYDFIVVDTSPVLPVVDPLLIGQHVDAAIFSILRDVSRLPEVHAAYERVETFGIRVLGAVINGSHESAYDARYRSQSLALA